MNKKKKLQNQKGSTALLLTMFLLVAMIGISMAISQIVVNGIEMGKTQVHSTKAFFAAEAGAEAMLWQVRENGYNYTGCSDNDYISLLDADCGGPGTAPCCPGAGDPDHVLTNNAFFEIKYDTPGANTELTCFGTFQGTRRVVQITY